MGVTIGAENPRLESGGHEMENKLYLYSIMPLDAEHVEETCQDIRSQYESGAATCALMCMTLVPEGNPPIDKAGQYCAVYDRVRDRLAEMGLDCGILVQASIGHGYPLNQMFGFQRCIGLSNGEALNKVCPYDENFRSHFRSVMRTLALHKPASIMVDDDFRLMHCVSGHGCACPLHMAEFNRRAGTNMTREELYRHTQGTSEEDRRYTKIFIETQGDSIIGAARAMREGIDSVDPSLPGSFCACGPAAEFAGEVAQILAGKGNPVIVRMNNGMYTWPGARRLTTKMMYAAVQKAVLEGKVDVLLDESDTCPQNRYSTGAQTVHAHLTGSILEGARGAKHWITRMHAFEPDSGKAYRAILAKNRGFYEALADLYPSLSWQGCRIPISSVPGYGFPSSPAAESMEGWPVCVLERLGLPLYFSPREGGAVFMDGPADELFTDEQLRALFKGPVFLASDTAMRLNARGFGDLTGVDIKPWTGAHPSAENLFINGNDCNVQEQVCELIPCHDGVRAESEVYHLRDGHIKEPLFPGVTVYDNPLGGRSVVFSGTPQAEFSFSKGFAFLNESRKKQLIHLLDEVNCLPVYYPGDAEMYLKAALCPNGEQLVALFNLGLDPLEDVELAVKKPVAAVEQLCADGTRRAVPFEKTQEGIVVNTPVNTLNPVVLFLKYED